MTLGEFKSSHSLTVAMHRKSFIPVDLISEVSVPLIHPLLAAVHVKSRQLDSLLCCIPRRVEKAQFPHSETPPESGGGLLPLRHGPWLVKNVYLMGLPPEGASPLQCQASRVLEIERDTVPPTIK